jgi:Domain of unknown function (DUF1816)
MKGIPTSVQPSLLRRSRPIPYVASSTHTWCVEINTAFPIGRYNFGPFSSRKEAEESRSSYVEVLCRKAARGIVALVKQYQPDEAMPLLGFGMPQLNVPINDRGAGPQKWF